MHGARTKPQVVVCGYHITRWLGLLLLVVVFSACIGGGAAPIEQKSSRQATPAKVTSNNRTSRVARTHKPPAVYRVRAGDTLHAIAWRYHLDYRDIVRWNRLKNPNLILVGQKLRLIPPATGASGTAKKKTAKTKPTTTPKVKPRTPAAAIKPVRWQWPSTGRTTRRQAASGSLGIEIRGRQGQAVVAAAAGAVVYSGSGLRGYGELIIVKHNEVYLSAYAHSEKRLVSEGQRVKAGQKIATMGKSEAREVMLHFEIRKNGKTVDPFAYLPKRKK